MTSLAYFVAALVLLCSAWTYFYYQKGHKEDRRTALRTFKSGRRGTEALRRRIRAFADKHSAWDKPLMVDLTFKEAVELLDEADQTLFTSENLDVLRSSDVESKTFASLSGRIQRERLRMSQIEDIFETYFEGEGNAKNEISSE